MDTMTCIIATWSSTFSIVLQYPTPLSFLNYETIISTIRMEPLPFLELHRPRKQWIPNETIDVNHQSRRK
jgi:hypothetical protein